MTWKECAVEIAGIDGKTLTIPTIKCIELIFERLLTVILSLSVLALFVMLLVGGFRYMTSGGDPKATTGAKQTMTYAMLGIALMAMAFLIFKIIEGFTGVNVTNFEIPEGLPPP